MIKKYSVVIRTLGVVTPKYMALIDSINNSTIKPCEVIVVVPEGYAPPTYNAINERVVFCQKGMVTQRLVGIEEAKTEILLVCDDDVEFENNFVEEALDIFNNDAKIDSIVPSSMITPAKMITISNILQSVIGVSYISLTTKYARKICSNGAFSRSYKIFKNDDGIYPTQTGNFQLFFIKKTLAEDVNFKEEMWLEDYGYALPDDQVFFYKAFLIGGNIIFVPSLKYTHLDARNGQDRTGSVRDIKYFISCRNYTIFWYRFIYTQKRFFGKCLCALSLLIKIFIRSIAYALLFLIKFDFVNMRHFFSGYIDAYKVCKKLNNWR